jgi:hypothetical protein
MESSIKYIIVSSKQIAQAHLYKFYHVLGSHITKIEELDNGNWFYTLPTDDLIGKFKNGITQQKLLNIVQDYTVFETRPSGILPDVKYVITDIATVKKNVTELKLNEDLSVKLKKKLVFDDKGWVVKKEYYKDVTTTLDSITGLQNKTYTDLILEETRSYNLDENKNLSTRDLSLGYADNRGNIDTLVEKVKNYTEFDEMLEAQRKRRVNVIDAILVPFVLNKFKELGITSNFTESDANLKLFASELSNEISNFKNYSDYDSLINGIQNLTFIWLDTDDGGMSFKQRIINKIIYSKL